MKSRKSNFSFESISFGLLAFATAFIISAAVIGWHATTKAGNESDAVFFVSSFHQKQSKYARRHSGRFAKDLTVLNESLEKLIGETENSNGYVFTIKIEESDSLKPSFYSINADPRVYYWLFPAGNRHFYFDSTLGTIKCTEENRQANSNDPSI